MLLKRGTLLRFVGSTALDRVAAAERELGPLRCNRVSRNEVRLTADIALPEATARNGSTPSTHATFTRADFR
jgi:hypothetical protein